MAYLQQPFPMNKILPTLMFSLTLFIADAQQFEKGPYTVSQLAPGVTRIEDANKQNPSGIHTGSDGKPAGLNNCSDMYLIQGKDKVLLIDLSNFITWDTTAITSLRSIVSSIRGNRQLYIAVTHFHGDHTGMLPAFKNDPAVRFWIHPKEFEGRNIFPEDRLIAIPENPTLDLGGGFVVESFELPGHTNHSMLYFLKEKNLVFTGDGLGSGNGVWIFSYDGFNQYRSSVDKLISYIKNPSNKVDASKLLIYPGHYWQNRDKPNLPFQYVLDMKTLIDKIKEGSAKTESVTFNPYLNTNFSYGSAVITWNKADAARFSSLK